MGRKNLSIVLGVMCAILLANVLHYYFGWIALAIAPGLIFGLEVGFWSYDFRATAKIHAEPIAFLFKKENSEELISALMLLLIVVCLVGVAVIGYFMEGIVLEYFNGAVSEMRWRREFIFPEDQSAFASIVTSMLFAKDLPSINFIPWVVIPFFIMAFTTLCEFESSWNEDVSVKKALFYIVTSLTLGVLTPVVILAIYAFFVVAIIAVVMAIPLLILYFVTRVYSEFDHISMSASITIGALSGLAYGWTHLVFWPTIITCGFGAVAGLVAFYLFTALAKTAVYDRMHSAISR